MTQFTRKPSFDVSISPEETGKHIKHLDGWRGIAVILVIVGHFWADEHIWPGTSKLGVELFFALSGRLMGEILFFRKSSLRRFFFRRLSRVYPGMLFYVVTTTLLFWASPYAHGLKAMLLAFTFTINYGMIYFHSVALMDHLWSLCVEEHTYVVLAAIALLTARSVKFAVYAIAALALAAILNGTIQAGILHKSFFEVHWRTDVAAASILLPGVAWLVLRSRSVPQWTALASLLLAIACKIASDQFLGFGLGTLFLAIAIATLDHSPKLALNILSHRSIRLIGLWSYSLYLWQQPFYKLHRDGAAPPIVLLAAVGACALASFYLVERPARRTLNAWFDGARGVRKAREAYAS